MKSGLLSVFFIALFLIGYNLITGYNIITQTYWSEGDYYVAKSPSDPSNKTLYIRSEEFNDHGRTWWIKRIGSNENFIIMEDISNKFWVLDKTKDNALLTDREITMGPFSAFEFEQKKVELKIKNLSFSHDL